MTQRIAIVEGFRTPFSRSWTNFKAMSSLDLAKTVVKELVNRTELDPKNLDEIIMGTVFHPVYFPNLAREVIIALGLPANILGYTVTRACASGIQAITCAAENIMADANKVIIAGGSESLSQLQIPYPHSVVQNLQKFAKADKISEKISHLSHLSVKDLLPVMPEIKELSTGFSMGEHAEQMARKNGISREQQDEYSLKSQGKAIKALESGFFAQEIVTTYPKPDYLPVSQDNNLRKDLQPEKVSSLPPVFDKKYGTVTAANSSPLTDGASAVLLMSEGQAKKLGYQPKAYIRAYSYSALDPNDQLLLGNAYSIPAVLTKANLNLEDIDLFEMHEAFSVQVLATLKALTSKNFALEKLGRKKAVGEIDPEKLNVNGGSLALGHPFGATGGRLLTTLMNKMNQAEKKYGLLSICAAGAMSVSMVIERD